MAQHNDLGEKGEAAACRFLQNSGHRILHRNWRYGRHEIDIIAENEDYIIFVEVKTRSSTRWGQPEDAVSEGRIKRMVEAADFYLNNNETDKEVRFDIVAITSGRNGFDINYIEDAFFAPIN
ncbi:putative endonuclease [Dysgonomonas sp. PH5-45]|uniref:YraN family protein n=1 Tax=unclassified Dysgonomonas TaxID=2630389 RepID=UPI002476FD45|nr:MULTISPECIES: YraN family protein [unclassified Dysgonomonas]MDH6354889.1 putative endonuclease [Dysgonomonas sp. PH5-45]MDH6387788.1 putative endonuclease [Dysgonomonas sp. PH5-37]